MDASVILEVDYKSIPRPESFSISGGAGKRGCARSGDLLLTAFSFFGFGFDSGSNSF